MKYLITVVLMSCLRTLVSAQNSRETKFKQVESLQNKISDQSLITKYHKIQSKVSCARECSNNNQCTSFFYNKNQRFCSLHSKDNIRLDQTTDMEGTKFFKLNPGKDFMSKGYTYSRTAGIWYKWHAERLTWISAVILCQRDDGDLFSPITQQQRHLMDQIIKMKSNWQPWIGCSVDNNQWVWSDGTAIDGTNWYPDEPYITDSEQCCGQSKLKWFSFRCSEKRPFMCEILPQ